MFVVKRSLVSASQTDDFRSDCGQSIRVKRFSFQHFFLKSEGEKSHFGSTLKFDVTWYFLWDEGQAILFYVSFLICYLFIYFSLWSSFFIYIDFSRNMASYSYDFFFWCCVREILCKTMMKGSLKIRHRLFIKIYVYVFRL